MPSSKLAGLQEILSSLQQTTKVRLGKRFKSNGEQKNKSNKRDSTLPCTWMKMRRFLSMRPLLDMGRKEKESPKEHRLPETLSEQGVKSNTTHRR